MALVLAFWERYGEFLISAAAIASLTTLAAALLLRQNQLVQSLKAPSVRMIAAIVVLMLSLGPACAIYTKYDPGYWETPGTKRVFGAVYHPVGRCYVFPVEPWRACCLGYARWWMPPKARLQDYGWGLGLRSNGGLFVVGM